MPGTDLDRRRLLVAGLGVAATWLLPTAGSARAANRPRRSAGGEPSSDSLHRPMRIGVIGAGWLGGTVGRLWVKAGHEVLFSSRHPEELVSMTRELGPRATAGTPRQAAEFGTVLLFAVPYDALPQLGKDDWPGQSPGQHVDLRLTARCRQDHLGEAIRTDRFGPTGRN